MAPDPAALLIAPGGALSLPENTLAELQTAGLDAHRLRATRGGCPRFLANGPRSRLEAAASALERAGVRPAVIDESDAARLPPLEVSGGIASETGAISLRVHGRASGPPGGARLLFVFGDLGRADAAPEAAEPRPGDGLERRALRALCPVLDVVWESGRIRVPGRQMSWRGLPGLSPSWAANFVRLVESLARQSGGAVLDLGFSGQDVPVEHAAGAREPVEGSERARAALFDRYSAAAALAWRAGLYRTGEAGTLAVVGPGVDAGAPAEPERVLAPVSRPRDASPVPWVRKGPPARRRIPSGLLLLVPFALLFLWAGPGRSPSRRNRQFAAAGFAVAGGGLIVLGLSRVSRRERLRAIPTSRVRSMALGPVEVCGRVVATASFTAPYSRSRCVWYRFEIEELRGSTAESGSYVSIERGSSGDVPFRVDDGTGSALVQPAGARVEVDPEVIALGADRRVREWILPEGAFVYIAGYAHRRSFSEDVSGSSEASDVFVGAGPDGVLVISPRSHGEQAARLAWRAALSFAAGVLCLLVAVALAAS